MPWGCPSGLVLASRRMTCREGWHDAKDKNSNGCDYYVLPSVNRRDIMTASRSFLSTLSLPLSLMLS